MSDAINKKDLNQLNFDEDQNTSISTIFDKSATEQKKILQRYWLYTEGRNKSDAPVESRYNLYKLYDNGINILEEDDWTITIGEKISSYTRIHLERNFDLITSTYRTIDDVIEYDEINDMLKYLNTTSPSSELTSIIFNWINKYVKLDYNTNPENADETNLILTHEIDKEFVKEATLSILEKVYRNLLQIIRVKHDFRLYGNGTTIFGGKSDVFKSNALLQDWSAIPSNCWKEKTECYVIGSKAYGEDIEVGDTIPHATTYISPYTSYGFLTHNHTASIGTINLPSKLTVGRCTEGPGAFGGLGEIAKLDDMEGGWRADDARAIAFGGTDAVVTFSLYLDNSWSWGGKTTTLPYNYTESNEWLSKEEVKLPSYLSYVWQWSGKDTTTVKTPSAYIKTFQEV